MTRKIFLITINLMVFSACQSDYKKTMKEPIAKQIPTVLNYHSDTLIDNYFWMRLSDAQKEAENADAQTQDVVDYLVEENTYLEANMSDTDTLQGKLFDEYVSRIKQDDQSVPYAENGYTYSSKFEQGDDYRRYFRTKNEAGSKEELILDLPTLAQSQKYFSLGDWSISTNNTIIAFSTDLISRR
ncbi:MAG: oligopeptidase B, partial [Flavobacteriales bacterium]|nr:oligopeptidase B [Flavobacteriales bacterium]